MALAHGLTEAGHAARAPRRDRQGDARRARRRADRHHLGADRDRSRPGHRSEPRSSRRPPTPARAARSRARWPASTSASRRRFSSHRRMRRWPGRCMHRPAGWRMRHPGLNPSKRGYPTCAPSRVAETGRIQVAGQRKLGGFKSGTISYVVASRSCGGVSGLCGGRFGEPDPPADHPQGGPARPGHRGDQPTGTAVSPGLVGCVMYAGS